MSEIFNFEPSYDADRTNKLFAFLATNSDINKLANKIQAAKSLKANQLSLKNYSSLAI